MYTSLSPQCQRAQAVWELSIAPTVTLNTKGGTSRGTESYFTATAHYISPEWEIKCPVLQTCPLYKCKSGRETKGLTVEKLNNNKNNINNENPVSQNHNSELLYFSIAFIHF